LFFLFFFIRTTIIALLVVGGRIVFTVLVVESISIKGRVCLDGFQLLKLFLRGSYP
ncbi:hypothetical protein DL95DRAFT_493426, partial [Leptodontidium sp. 2 PMI_412]